MSRYGRKDCKHDWVYRKDGWEEQCVPVICAKCGAFGCACDMKRRPSWEKLTIRGLNSTDDNGTWINPYIKLAENDMRRMLK